MNFNLYIHTHTHKHKRDKRTLLDQRKISTTPTTLMKLNNHHNRAPIYTFIVQTTCFCYYVTAFAFEHSKIVAKWKTKIKTSDPSPEHDMCASVPISHLDRSRSIAMVSWPSSETTWRWSKLDMDIVCDHILTNSRAYHAVPICPDLIRSCINRSAITFVRLSFSQYVHRCQWFNFADRVHCWR